jgi:hypothetical protein
LSFFIKRIIPEYKRVHKPSQENVKPHDTTVSQSVKPALSES